MTGELKLVAGTRLCKRNGDASEQGLEREVSPSERPHPESSSVGLDYGRQSLGRRELCRGDQGTRRPGAYTMSIWKGSQEGDHWGCKVSKYRVFRVHRCNRAPLVIHIFTLQPLLEQLERAGKPLPPEMFLYRPLLRKFDTMFIVKEFCSLLRACIEV